MGIATNWSRRICAALALVWFAAATAPPAAAQSFDEIRAAYQRGDYAVAIRWFRRYAERGVAAAQFNLGIMYHSGKGVPQDHAEAAKWWHRAAEQGNAKAQFNLGLMYNRGWGVPQDYAEAAKWYRHAAEQGIAQAQFNLGVIYHSGRDIPQDYTAVTKLYRLAAEQGLAEAQFNLGVMYAEGQGVQQDYAEAVKWYGRAAEQGNAHAQNNLGVMYENGRGVHRNHVQAHKWYNLAASGYPTSKQEHRDTAVRNRERVASKLSPNELARAQRMAREWHSRKEGVAPASEPPDAGAEARPAPPALEKASTGSGFRVSAGGRILTNAHVVEGCAEIRLPPRPAPVRVVARDGAVDLALLDGPAGGAAAAFREGRGVRLGAPVVVLGYPLRGVLASGANVTTGNVAALAGPGDDRRLIQITAPVQPGNSGGPVLDSAGNAVGVVVSKLNAIKVARATGDIPQNVNFAVAAGAARAFLDAEGVSYATARSDAARSPEDIAAAARAFTVPVECWKPRG